MLSQEEHIEYLESLPELPSSVSGMIVHGVGFHLPDSPLWVECWDHQYVTLGLSNRKDGDLRERKYFEFSISDLECLSYQNGLYIASKLQYNLDHYFDDDNAERFIQRRISFQKEYVLKIA